MVHTCAAYDLNTARFGLLSSLGADFSLNCFRILLGDSGPSNTDAGTTFVFKCPEHKANKQPSWYIFSTLRKESNLWWGSLVVLACPRNARFHFAAQAFPERTWLLPQL
jgi:hypothetical protein